ncbi:hypothetical protein L596_012848 [Steinernema carpocapsae]|uniref:Sulfatase N-terminal domain-containing protein n=1 Tax=Steinernema carpocapsae TaxID=34508 RepID=A0A4U5NYB4_STECR|nr:hypothetical protein L596_012848 [Steinernema carpocapsae]
MSQAYFDDWPFIWNNFSAHDYTTYYAEDLPKYNLFSYLSNGFKGKPVDHYFRPFWLKVHENLVYRRSTPLCFGNKPSYVHQLYYLESFIKAYKNKAPIFAFNWLTEIGHDWSHQVGVADHDIAEFFKKMREDLKDSYVFVFSDHGHRFDPVRQTVIGRLEERLPFFSVHVPEKEVAKNPELKEILKIKPLLTTPTMAIVYFNTYLTTELVKTLTSQKSNASVNKRYRWTSKLQKLP